MLYRINKRNYSINNHTIKNVHCSRVGNPDNLRFALIKGKDNKGEVNFDERSEELEQGHDRTDGV